MRYILGVAFLLLGSCTTADHPGRDVPDFASPEYYYEEFRRALIESGLRRPDEKIGVFSRSADYPFEDVTFFIDMPYEGIGIAVDFSRWPIKPSPILSNVTSDDYLFRVVISDYISQDDVSTFEQGAVSTIEQYWLSVAQDDFQTLRQEMAVSDFQNVAASPLQEEYICTPPITIWYFEVRTDESSGFVKRDPCDRGFLTDLKYITPLLTILETNRLDLHGFVLEQLGVVKARHKDRHEARHDE
ncbi:MAG: hypothetical protein MRY72_06830 [Aquisalinus sp.]|nr:hypothetical protein [Aquisalinus sp.]